MKLTQTETETETRDTRFYTTLDGLTDLSDINHNQQQMDTIYIPTLVTEDEVRDVIWKFLNRKALGPDGILNKALKIITPIIAKELAQAITRLLQTSNIPSSYKESITAVIRKERKGNYILLSSYRLVALENTLAKVVE